MKQSLQEDLFFTMNKIFYSRYFYIVFLLTNTVYLDHITFKNLSQKNNKKTNKNNNNKTTKNRQLKYCKSFCITPFFVVFSLPVSEFKTSLRPPSSSPGISYSFFLSLSVCLSVYLSLSLSLTLSLSLSPSFSFSPSLVFSLFFQNLFGEKKKRHKISHLESCNGFQIE